MKHTCHAYGCQTPCPPSKLMCLAHWRQVPKALQDAVYAAYQPGQERSKTPSAAWLLAAFMAIDFLAVKEGRISQTNADDRAQRYRDKAAKEAQA